MADTEANEQSEATTRQEDAKALRQAIGERLAQARQEKKLDIIDVSSELRISSIYIEALEAGDWSGLPGEVYAQGFLRQYAGLLAIDISDDIKQLKSTDYHLTKPFTMPDPPIAPQKKWAIGAAAAFVVLIIFFNVRQSDDSLQPEAPTAIQQSSTMTLSDAAKTTPDVEIPAIVPALDPVPVAVQPPVEQSTAPEAQAGYHDFTFTAQGNSVWLQIFDADRQLLKEALLRPGEVIRMQGMDKLFITCGNAAALEISMDGKIWAAAGTLGDENQVRRWLAVESG